MSVAFKRFFGSIFFVVNFAAQVATAGWDLGVSGSGRSYPVGGSLKIESGYGVLLWGSRETGAAPAPWYGYLRPAIELTTAGVYNHGEARLEIFPLAFLGGAVGQTLSHMGDDYSDFDCVQLVCQGRLGSQFAEASLALGAKGVFFLSEYRYEKFTHEFTDRSFLVIDYGLAGQAEKEDLKIFTHVLGYQWSPEWAVLLLNVYAETVKVPSLSRMTTLNLAYTRQDWTFVIGAGNFESTLKKNDVTVLGRVAWRIKPSLGLF